MHCTRSTFLASSHCDPFDPLRTWPIQPHIRRPVFISRRDPASEKENCSKITKKTPAHRTLSRPTLDRQRHSAHARLHRLSSVVGFSLPNRVIIYLTHWDKRDRVISRSRKTRCDGARPTCRNCVNRASDEPCSYDETPNRRGPDKDPGARQRAKILGLPFEPRRRRRTESGATDDGVEREPVVQDLPLHSNQSGSPSQHPSDVFDPQTHPNPHPHSPIDDYDASARPIAQDIRPQANTLLPTESFGYSGRNSPLDRYVYITTPTYAPAQSTPPETYFDSNPTIVPGPSLSYTRQTWWDSLLILYATSGDFLDSASLTLTQTQREVASNHIFFDIKFLFRMAPYLFCFFNVPRFFSVFSDNSRRLEMQPSYILATLALATYLQSSETGLGAEGRNKALRLRDEAQSALDASLNSGRLDHDLAKAAWVR